MKSIVHICDQCGKQQEDHHLTWRLSSNLPYIMITSKDFCSLKCVIEWCNSHLDMDEQDNDSE